MASKTEALRLFRDEVRKKSVSMDKEFSGNRPSFLLYTAVTMIAFLKDLLDLVGIGSLPALGTVVTFCFTFLIWILLFTFDRSGGSKNTKMIRGLVLGAVAIVEGFGFGLNFFPVETMSVILLYQLARRAWKRHMKGSQKSLMQPASL